MESCDDNSNGLFQVLPSLILICLHNIPKEDQKSQVSDLVCQISMYTKLLLGMTSTDRMIEYGNVCYTIKPLFTLETRCRLE